VRQRHYKLVGLAPAPAFALPPGYDGRFWTPSLREPVPPGLSARPFAAWTAMHYLHGFRNRLFSIYLVSRAGQLVHRSCVLPAWYRLPFMAAQDIQIAATHTAPAARGQGLARAAVSAIVARFRAPGRTIWYFANEDNRASLRVIEQCGFACAGEGVRTRRHGLALLGQFVIDRPVDLAEPERPDAHGEPGPDAHDEPGPDAHGEPGPDDLGEPGRPDQPAR
jgi:GNAT superfamily N-acetyltransferase